MKTTKSSASGGVCSEEVFRSLAQRESIRAERSGHRCRILLVYHANAHGHVLPLSSELADKTVSLLSTSLRATDSIGWYRDGYILGSLLATLQPDSAVDGCDNLTTRLMDGLRGALRTSDAESIQIRVLEPSELTALGSMQDVKRAT